MKTFTLTRLNVEWGRVSIDDIANYIGHETSKVTEDYYLKTSLEKESKINQVINEFITKIL